jgi:hypothetical protein
MSSRSNVSGAFERARQRWHFAVIYVSRGMGRGATGALQTAGLLVEYSSRALFHRDGHLVAFPGLDLLAMLAGVNEKTIRRAMGKLEQAGLVQTQQRYNDSNLYYLTIPPDADAHLFACDLARSKRRRGKRYGLRNPPDNAVTKCPPDRTDGKGVNTKCPTTSEYTSDLRSIPKGHPSDAEEKRLGEKERIGSSQLGHLYREARELGKDGGSIVEQAVKDWGRDAEDVRNAIDTVRDFGGDTGDLAHELWEPE